MSVPKVIEQYLDRHHLHAEEHRHPAVYTARQLARAEQLPEADVAKVVFFFIDDRMALGVLPADRNLNLHRIRKETGARGVRLASEREIGLHIDTLQLGAIPPFGSMFGLPVYMDEALLGHEMVEIPGGIHTESIRMRLEDFMREESPTLMALSRAPIRRKPPFKHRRMFFF
jgi:Ala-tRNA(Pro) deacylase